MIHSFINYALSVGILIGVCVIASSVTDLEDRIKEMEGDIRGIEYRLENHLGEEACIKLGGVYDQFAGSVVVGSGFNTTTMPVPQCTKNGANYKYDGRAWLIEKQINTTYLK